MRTYDITVTVTMEGTDLDEAIDKLAGVLADSSVEYFFDDAEEVKR